jgi:uncharacterized protein DUF3987/Toprim domain-containing protein
VTPIQRVEEALRVCGCKRSSPGSWTCPGHQDHKASLSVSEGQDGRALVKCHAGCSFDQILAALDLKPGDMFPDAGNRSGGLGKIAATYDYTDQNGDLVLQVVRFTPKSFRQRRPDVFGGWRWDLKGIKKRPLYRLRELLAADPDAVVFFVEGERDTLNLTRIGLVATTASQGAGKIKHTDLTQLQGRDVVILPDQDKAGEDHAREVARALRGIASRVTVLRLPGLADKQDVSDWLAGGGTADDLRRLADEALQAINSKPDRARDAALSEGEAAGLADNPTALPPRPWIPFPLDALPRQIRRYVEQAAKSLVVEAVMVALPFLVSLAAAIGTTRRLRLTQGAEPWYAYAIIWSATIATSSAKKSPSLAVALAPLRRLNAAIERESAAAMRRYREELLRYQKMLAKWKREKGEGNPPVEPTRPPWRQCITNDTTIEALALILADNPRGVSMIRDELAAWIGSHDAYHGGDHRDTPAWLELYRAGDLAVDRVTHRLQGREPLRVKGAGVSVTGTIQPSVIEKIADEHLEDGMLPRFFLAMPPLQKKVWTDRGVSPEVAAEVDNVMIQLGKLNHDEIEHLCSDGHVAVEYRPIDLELSPDALEIWISWYAEHAERQMEAEGPVSYAHGKIEELAARLALIFQLVVEPGSLVVGGEAMQAGVTIARWAAYEAERIYATWATPSDEREINRLAEWVRQRPGGRVTAVELARSGPRRFRNKKDIAEQELERLVDAGQLVREASEPGRGAPTTVYRVAWIHEPAKTPEIWSEDEPPYPLHREDPENDGREEVSL